MLLQQKTFRKILTSLENMSVEEVEAAFEIEETEQEEENISADEVPLFKQRDRE